MALELVTGYWGTQHVTAEQDADLNAGIIGKDPCVLDVGEKLRAETITANKVRIYDGVFSGYGRIFSISQGGYQDITIENGTANQKRNDMIVVKYAKNEETGVEAGALAVLKGQTGATATDPTPNNQDIRTGVTVSEMPLYRVKLNGLTIEAVEPLYSLPKTLRSMDDATNIINKVYPVGSIYMSVVATDPSTLFGGTWVAWGTGRVPVGINPDDTNFATVEKMAGEMVTDISHSHATGDYALTEAQMPSHTHAISYNNNNEQFVGGGEATGGAVNANLLGGGGNFTSGKQFSISATGGNQAHNHGNVGAPINSESARITTLSNLQPYIVCYMWKRTA